MTTEEIKTGDVEADLYLIFYNAFDEHFKKYGTEDGQLSKLFKVDKFIENYKGSYRRGKLINSIAFNLYFEEKDGMELQKFFDFGKYNDMINTLINYRKENEPEKVKQRLAKRGMLIDYCEDFVKNNPLVKTKNKKKDALELLDNVYKIMGGGK